MALTLTRRASGVMGDLGYWIGTAQFDNSLADNGESFTPANAGLDDFAHISITADQLAATTAYVPGFDDSANKILLFDCGGSDDPLDEVGSGTDTSNLVVYIRAFGKVGNQ